MLRSAWGSQPGGAVRPGPGRGWPPGRAGPLPPPGGQAVPQRRLLCMDGTAFWVMKYSQVSDSVRNDGDQSIPFQGVIFLPSAAVFRVGYRQPERGADRRARRGPGRAAASSQAARGSEPAQAPAWAAGKAPGRRRAGAMSRAGWWPRMPHPPGRGAEAAPQDTPTGRRGHPPLRELPRPPACPSAQLGEDRLRAGDRPHRLDRRCRHFGLRSQL